MATMETAFKDIQALAKDFKANEHYYTSSAYNEQPARHDFIDKFLIALAGMLTTIAKRTHLSRKLN